MEQFTLFDANSEYYEIDPSTIDTDNLNFKVHASVIYKLGESLIADEVTALSELMKNSYDADASFCKLEIDPDYIDGSQIGRITISDNGCGMDLQTIIGGWLTISNSPKKKMKSNKETTKKYHRIPLGEKGLGRLSVQKLGKNLKMITKQADSEDEYSIEIPWSDFLQNTTIDNIHIPFKKKTVHTTQSYTQIIITDLINPQFWKDEQTVKNLERTIGRIISPFRFSTNSFVVSATVGKYKIDVANTVFNDVLNTARCEYSFNVHDDQIFLKCSYKLDYFKRRKFEAKYDFDYSRDYFEEMYKNTRKDIEGWRYRSEGDVLYDIETTIDLRNYPALRRDPISKKVIHPGDFEGAIYVFYYDGDYITSLLSAHHLTEVFNETEYRKYVRDNKGIKVIRDGFVVQGYGDGNVDWLNLSGSATTSGKFGDLNNESVIGYVRLTGQNNQNLKETTSREGFVNDEYFQNFYEILRNIVIKRINSTGQKLSAIYSQYLENLFPSNDHEKPIEQIESISKMAGTISKDIKRQADDTTDFVNRALQKARTTQDQVSIFDNTPHNVSTQYEDIIAKQTQTIVAMEKALSEYLSKVDSVNQEIGEIQNEVNAYKEKMGDVFELAGLGVSVELFTHELYTTINNVNEKAAALGKESAEMRYIQNAMNSLRKQISYFHPGLKYVRLKKDNVSLRGLVQDHMNFYHTKCEQHGITQVVKIAKDVQVKMNVGLLNQVLDNLFSNSFYWLIYSRDTLRCVDNCEFHIEITQDGMLNVWDNGIGVAKDIETDLFNPFVTCKQDGRGLGLFICRNNLENNGSSIRLLRERNQHGNLYKFQINLTNVVTKG